MRLVRLLAAAVLVAACGTSAEPTLAPVVSVPGSTATSGFVGRADLDPTGNKVSVGAGDLDGPTIDIRLDSPAEWLVPSSAEAGAPWEAVQSDGRLVWVDPQAGTVDVLDEVWGVVEPIVRGVDGIERWDLTASFPAALPDGRSVTDGEVVVLLADPTERYRHRVLGDAVEAAAIEIYAADDGAIERRIELPSDVVEGLSPMLGDADGDGENEILVTQSNADEGARLVLYELDGTVAAESQPIGRGNRWRNQMAIAPVGPDGEMEIVDVRTPHLGRVLQWFRVEGDDLVRVAFLDGFTSHVIGSRNLELAIVADADADGRLEVIAPVPDLTALAVVARTDDGAEVEFTIPLGAALSSNVGAVDHPDGGATYAAGTTDGLVRFWVS
ncbi:MAG: hypothetical protein AAF081_11915 [Actinomycetota bacterium]